MDAPARRRKLFYAEAEAGLYDHTIEWVVPQYALLHEAIREVLRARRAAGAPTSAVLDVGSGTGAETRAVLEELPDTEVIALDVCAPIQAIHQERASAEELKRTTFVTADVVECIDHPCGLRQWLADDSPGYDMVVTALTIHHLSHAAKARFYEAAFEALNRGGRLINADLFSLSDTTLDRAALEYNLRWIRSQFEAAAEAASIQAPKADELTRRWVAHYLNDNLCEPLEDPRDGQGQGSMVMEAGFDAVSVVYRHSMTGVLTGVRPH